MEQNTIALEPFVYKPIVINNKVKDDISEFSATDFKMTGITDRNYYIPRTQALYFLFLHSASLSFCSRRIHSCNSRSSLSFFQFYRLLSC